MTEKLDRTLEERIYSWLSDVSGLEVVQANEAYRNPEIEGDFISYLIGAPIRIGSDEMTYNKDSDFTIKGLRLVPIDVRIYASDAMKRALALQLSLSRPTILEAYFRGFGFLNDDGIQDISGALDTGFETRALLTFTLTMGVGVSDTVGYIETVGAKITITDLLDDVKYEEVFDINKIEEE